MSTNQAAEFESTVRKSLESNVGADLGSPLMEKPFDQAKFDQASAYMSGDLAYYEGVVARLMGRPEAKDFFNWMQSEAMDDSNVLFKLLAAKAGTGDSSLT